MKNVVVMSQKEIEKYRGKIFRAKERFHKMQAKLPFEKKIEIVMRLSKFVKDFKKHAKIVKR